MNNNLAKKALPIIKETKILANKANNEQAIPIKKNKLKVDTTVKGKKIDYLPDDFLSTKEYRTINEINIGISYDVQLSGKSKYEYILDALIEELKINGVGENGNISLFHSLLGIKYDQHSTARVMRLFYIMKRRKCFEKYFLEYETYTFVKPNLDNIIKLRNEVHKSLRSDNPININKEKQSVRFVLNGEAGEIYFEETGKIPFDGLRAKLIDYFYTREDTRLFYSYKDIKEHLGISTSSEIIRKDINAINDRIKKETKGICYRIIDNDGELTTNKRLNYRWQVYITKHSPVSPIASCWTA